MVHCLRIGLFILLGLAAACRDKPAAAPLQPETATTPDGSPVAAAPIVPPKIVGKYLVVFGLNLPADLEPGQAPPKVYRFEGQYPFAYLAGVVTEQVDKPPIDESGPAKLFRETRAKTGSATAAPLISVRVGRVGQLGSYIDVWLEEDSTRQGAASQRRWLPGQAAGLNQARASSGEVARRKSTYLKAVSAAEKAAKGQKLTPEEERLIH